MPRSSILLIALLASPLAFAVGTGPTTLTTRTTRHPGRAWIAPSTRSKSPCRGILTRAFKVTTPKARRPSKMTTATCRGWMAAVRRVPVLREIVAPVQVPPEYATQWATAQHCRLCIPCGSGFTRPVE